MTSRNKYMIVFNNIFLVWYLCVCVCVFCFVFNCPTLPVLPVNKDRKIDRVAKLLFGRKLRLLKEGGR